MSEWILAAIGAVAGTACLAWITALAAYGQSRCRIWLGVRLAARAESLIASGHDYELRQRQRVATVARLTVEHLKGEAA